MQKPLDVLKNSLEAENLTFAEIIAEKEAKEKYLAIVLLARHDIEREISETRSRLEKLNSMLIREKPSLLVIVKRSHGPKEKKSEFTSLRDAIGEEAMDMLLGDIL